jgi:hypothetical protein
MARPEAFALPPGDRAAARAGSSPSVNPDRHARRAELGLGEGPSGGGGSVGHLEDPGIIGMESGGRGSCGENPTGQVVSLGFSWQAREGNTVDISYAYTDGDYEATGGFILLPSGLGSSGSVSIPVTCPVGPGPAPYVTVKAVPSSASGSAAAYYWGL